MIHTFKICNEISEPLAKVVSVDGFVKGSDIVFDHHKKGGADIQLDELPDVFNHNEPCIFVSPLLDEDCVISTATLCIGGTSELTEGVKSELRKASLACDQLEEPNALFYAIKDYDGLLIKEHKSKDQRYSILVDFVISFTKNERITYDPFISWKGNFKKSLTKQKVLLFQYSIIRKLSDIIAYVNIKDHAYISPWVIYEELRKEKITFALIEYRSKNEGRIYTLGMDPKTEMDRDVVFEIFEQLNKIDLHIDESNLWGGRFGVGGSPQLRGSYLTPYEIKNEIEKVVDGK